MTVLRPPYRLLRRASDTWPFDRCLRIHTEEQRLLATGRIRPTRSRRLGRWLARVYEVTG